MCWRIRHEVMVQNLGWKNLEVATGLCMNSHSIVSIWWCFRREANVQTLGWTFPTKRNMEKYFFFDFLTANFWQKL